MRPVLVGALGFAIGCANVPRVASPAPPTESFKPIVSPDSPLLDRTSMGVLLQFRASIAGLNAPGLLDPASQLELAAQNERDAACVRRINDVDLEGTGHADERATWLVAADRATRRILPLALDAAHPARAATLRAMAPIDSQVRAETVVATLGGWEDAKSAERVAAHRGWWPSQWSSQWGPKNPPEASLADYAEHAIVAAQGTFVLPRAPTCVSSDGTPLDCAEPTAEDIQRDAESALAVLAEDAMEAGAPHARVYEELCATFEAMVTSARRQGPSSAPAPRPR